MTVNNVTRLALRVLFKHRLFWLSAFVLFSILASAALAAEFGGRQPATLALDVGISALRLLLPLFIIIQVQDLFSSEFERRFYLLSLAYPISRSEWFVGRFFALLIVVSLLLLLSMLLLAAEVAAISQGYAQPTPVSLGIPLAVTTLFIGLDLLVLMTLAGFLAVAASTPSFVLVGTLGFMLIARSYASVLALLAGNAALVDNAETYRHGLGILGYLLPDLGALDVRAMALYGRMDFLPGDWPLLAGSALFYGFGFLALAIWLFRRKRFA